MGLKPRGVLIGLVGNVLIGVALYHLIQQGSCGDVGQPSCHSEVVPYVLMLPVGILLSVAAAFLGGAALTFTGTFLAVGLGSMAASAFGDNPETRTFGWVFGGAFVFFGLAPAVFLAWAARSGRGRIERGAALVATGAQGVGTITQVRDTGVTINDNPRVEITMRVEPVDGSAAFDASKTVTVSRVAIPRAGDRHPVWYDRADPSKWVYGTDLQAGAAPEVRALFARADSAGVAFNAPVAATRSPLDELSQLNDLRMKGALTDEEFQQAKDRLLGEIGR